MVLAARYKHSFLCDLIVHLTPALHSAQPRHGTAATRCIQSALLHATPGASHWSGHTPPGRVWPCGYCGRWNIEWMKTERRKIIVWPQNLLSFNFIKGIKKQGYGRWNENHLWMYILEWIPTLIVHCSSNEASHVRISACFVCGLYLNYTIRTIAHPLVSYWPQGNVLILQVCCCITTQQSHSIPFHEGLNML